LDRVRVGEQRYYYFEGRRYPSVTTILKQGLSKPIELELWELYLGSEAEQIKDIRSFIGTIAHYRLASKMAVKHSLPMPELQINKTREIDSEVTQILNSIARKCDEWIELFEPVALKVEQVVVNRELGYAGTIDLLAKLRDKLFLIDFKTSRAVYPEHFAQVAAYINCFTNEHLNAANEHLNAAILRTNEESAEFKILSESELESGFELFLKAKENYDKNYLGGECGC
jgi:hypothetical protein